MVAGAHANKFYADVARSNSVWTVGDKNAIPVTALSNGRRVLPLWSTRRRVEKIVTAVPGYSECVVLGCSWDNFLDNWAEPLKKDGVLVGINWSGSRANGYEMPVELLVKAVDSAKQGSA